MTIEKTIKVEIPEVEFTKPVEKKYFESLVADVVKEHGVKGLIIALENYLNL